MSIGGYVLAPLSRGFSPGSKGTPESSNRRGCFRTKSGAVDSRISAADNVSHKPKGGLRKCAGLVIYFLSRHKRLVSLLVPCQQAVYKSIICLACWSSAIPLIEERAHLLQPVALGNYGPVGEDEGFWSVSARRGRAHRSWGRIDCHLFRGRASGGSKRACSATCIAEKTNSPLSTMGASALAG